MRNVSLLVISMLIAGSSVCLAQEQTVVRREHGRPLLTAEQESHLQSLRDTVVAIPNAACTGPIAVSVTGSGHYSAGQDVLLAYSNTVTNMGSAWPANFVFFAPCDGLYYFNVTFVKDAYYYGGTTDDVSIYLFKNAYYIGQAWSGEGTGYRGTGAYGVALQLQQGDYVFTTVHSDGGPMRHLVEYNFTGFLIR